MGNRAGIAHRCQPDPPAAATSGANYFNGHEHDLEHIVERGSKVNYICTGAGKFCCYADWTRSPKAPFSLLCPGGGTDWWGGGRGAHLNSNCSQASCVHACPHPVFLLLFICVLAYLLACYYLLPLASEHLADAAGSGCLLSVAQTSYRIGVDSCEFITAHNGTLLYITAILPRTKTTAVPPPAPFCSTTTCPANWTRPSPAPTPGKFPPSPPTPPAPTPSGTTWECHKNMQPVGPAGQARKPTIPHLLSAKRQPQQRLAKTHVKNSWLRSDNVARC